MFGVKGPTIERMFLGFIGKVQDRSYNAFVKQWEGFHTMERIVYDKNTFKYKNSSL